MKVLNLQTKASPRLQRLSQSLPPSSTTLAKAAALSVGVASSWPVHSVLASEMTCTAIPDSNAFRCVSNTDVAKSDRTLPGKIVDGALGFLKTLGPIAQGAVVGASVVGAVGFVGGFMIGGLPDNSPDPIGAGMTLGVLGALVGGGLGTLVGVGIWLL